MFRYSPSGLLADRYRRADNLPLTVIHAAGLFDGRDVIEAASLVIERGLIRDIGSTSSIRVPADAARLSLDDAWLMPGLVDVRAYPVGRAPDTVARPQSERFRSSGPILLHRAVRDANAMLGGGITAAAQLGEADLEYVIGLREGARAGLIAAPATMVGYPLSPIGGGVEAWTEPRNDPDRKLPGTGQLRRPTRQSATVAATPDGFRKAIRRAFVDGSDMVALLLTAETPAEHLTMTDDEMAATVDEAHRVGAPIAVQARGVRPAKLAVRAGADLLVLGPDEPDDELVAMLARGTTAWAPSLATRSAVTPHLRAAVSGVSAAGGRIVIGSNWRAGAPVAYSAELDAIVATGISPLEALRSATVHGAAALRLPRGPLVTGRPADFVAFSFDPRRDHSSLGASGAARLIVQSITGRQLTPLQSLLAVPTPA